MIRIRRESKVSGEPGSKNKTERRRKKNEAMNGIYYEGKAGGGRWRKRPRENTEQVKEREENV